MTTTTEAHRRFAPGVRRFTLPAMGTVVDVAYAAPGPDALVDRVASLLVRLESRFSKFLPESDVSRCNRAGGAWVEVAPETAELLAGALQAARESGGCFTPAIGRLSALWNVKAWLAVLATGRQSRLPSPSEIEEARGACDPELIEIDRVRVRLRAGAQLDLDGVAKGYTADVVRDACLETGATNVLCSVGMSSIAASGPRPDGEPWRIGIRAVDGGQRSIVGTVEIVGGSLATSGDYLQRLPHLVSGRLVHHVIDPRTGYPSDSGVRQASVTAPSGVLAEAAATTLMVGGTLAWDDIEWVCVADSVRHSSGLAWLDVDPHNSTCSPMTTVRRGGR